MTKKPTISLCMIVKNEENNLARSINSVLSLIDEIIIVDTGSNDRTIEIAKSFTNKIYFHKFRDNFSEIRNISLSHATKDWIIVLDADEFFEINDLNKIQSAITHNKDDAYYCEWIQITENNWFGLGNKLAIFRNYSCLRYEGIIHEDLYPSLFRNNLKISRIDVHLYHNFNCKGTKFLNERHNFYLNLLTKQLQQTPNDSRMNYLMALELRINNLPGSSEYYSKSYTTPTRPLFAAFSLLELGWMFYQTDIQKSHEYFNKGRELMNKYKNDPEIMMNKDYLQHAYKSI